MSIPTTRDTFKSFCLRALGAPVIEINVDDDQVEDRIDYALSYYADYHFDATEKQYYKHEILVEDYPDVVKQVTINAGGTGYTNGAALVFTATQGQNAAGTITTDGSGAITSLTLTDNGDSYALAPTVSVAGGSGADLQAELGGWITMPENIIGTVGIFDLTNAITNISNMFSIQYQIALNEIWSLSSYSMVPYYTTIMHLSLIQQLLVGQQSIRYTRHSNRVYLDMAWQRVIPGQFLIVEAYQIIDPTIYPDVWKDRWLIRYCTAHIKMIWGNNLKKFGDLPLPGGVTFNGQIIYDEAFSEIKMLEDEMINSYSIPNQIFTG